LSCPCPNKLTLFELELPVTEYTIALLEILDRKTAFYRAMMVRMMID
jgi:hypothetical protein